MVDELLKYLVVADFSMREEIVLKTAVLAERFHPSLQWYVDSMLTLIERAGEFATKDIWCGACGSLCHNLAFAGDLSVWHSHGMRLVDTVLSRDGKKTVRLG